MKHYWFKPKRFWKWFAAYYPVSKEGWAITIVLAALLAGIFLYANAESRSVRDALYSIALPWIIVLLVFDLVSFRTGEYPSWWRRFGGKDKDTLE